MRNSRAFTTLELLIAIGVLVVLLGIVVIGARSITSGSKQRDTKVRLEALAGMLTEFEAVTGVGLKRQPGKMYRDNNGVPQLVDATTLTGGKFIDIWRDADPTTDNIPVTNSVGQPVPAPGDVTESAFISGQPGRFRSTAVHNTQVVMGLLTGVASVKQMLDRLPANAIANNPNKSGTLNMGSLTFVGNNTTAFRPPLVVDAWDNPIIFVPAGGLDQVNVAGSVVRITSRGAIGAGTLTAPTAGVRPFFASAGPDGSFSAGDDNVYSFEN